MLPDGKSAESTVNLEDCGGEQIACRHVDVYEVGGIGSRTILLCHVIAQQGKAVQQQRVLLARSP